MHTHFSSAFMLGALILWSVDWSRVTWAFRSWAIFFTSAASSTWTARDTIINNEIQLPWWISQTWHIYYQKQYVENIPHWEVMKASQSYSLLVRMSHMIYSHAPLYKYLFTTYPQLTNPGPLLCKLRAHIFPGVTYALTQTTNKPLSAPHPAVSSLSQYVIPSRRPHVLPGWSCCQHPSWLW